CIKQVDKHHQPCKKSHNRNSIPDESHTKRHFQCRQHQNRDRKKQFTDSNLPFPDFLTTMLFIHQVPDIHFPEQSSRTRSGSASRIWSTRLSKDSVVCV